MWRVPKTHHTCCIVAVWHETPRLNAYNKSKLLRNAFLWRIVKDAYSAVTLQPQYPTTWEDRPRPRNAGKFGSSLALPRELSRARDVNDAAISVPLTDAIFVGCLGALSYWVDADRLWVGGWLVGWGVWWRCILESCCAWGSTGVALGPCDKQEHKRSTCC